MNTVDRNLNKHEMFMTRNVMWKKILGGNKGQYTEYSDYSQLRIVFTASGRLQREVECNVEAACNAEACGSMWRRSETWRSLGCVPL